MTIAKIKIGDQVQVTNGADKGKVGEVMDIDGRRIKVSGIKMMTKHVKPNPQKDEKGGIVRKEAWLDHSNVVLYDVSSQKPYKVGIREENGQKVRFDKRSGALIDEVKTK